MQSNQTDQELLALFHDPSSREKGFTLIVNQYKEKLYWHIRRLVVVHEDADDILQNVFIKIWKGLQHFREESNLYTWLYRIATNECITHFDKLKRIRPFEVNRLEINLEDQVKADEYFDASKAEWKLQLAIQALPTQQRIVFNLRYFEAMPYKEMSNILGVSEGSLKASYHHAAKKIEDFIINH